MNLGLQVFAESCSRGGARRRHDAMASSARNYSRSDRTTSSAVLGYAKGMSRRERSLSSRHPDRDCAPPPNQVPRPDRPNNGTHENEIALSVIYHEAAYAGFPPPTTLADRPRGCWRLTCQRDVCHGRVRKLRPPKLPATDAEPQRLQPPRRSENPDLLFEFERSNRLSKVACPFERARRLAGSTGQPKSVAQRPFAHGGDHPHRPQKKNFRLHVGPPSPRGIPTRPRCRAARFSGDAGRPYARPDPSYVGDVA